MVDNPIREKTKVLIGVCAVQAAVGAIHAWPVFATLLRQAGATPAGTRAVGTAMNVMWLAGLFVAAYAIKKHNAQRLLMVGGGLAAAGYVLAGVFGARVLMNLLFVGFFAGAGLGIAFGVSLDRGIRWFSDRPGLLLGAAFASAGFSGMLFSRLGGSLQSLGPFSTRLTYFVFGGLILVLHIAGAYLLRSPAEEEDVPPFSTGELWRSADFFRVVVVAVLALGATGLVMKLLKTYPAEQLIAHGDLRDNQARMVAVIAMGFFFSFANGIGRLVWGLLADAWGARRVFAVLLFAQAVFTVLFLGMTQNIWLVYLGCAVLGWNYGGMYSLLGTFAATRFGTAHFARLFAWIFLAYAVLDTFIEATLLQSMAAVPAPALFTAAAVLTLAAAGLMATAKPRQA